MVTKSHLLAHPLSVALFVSMLLVAVVVTQLRYDRIQEEHFYIRAPIHRYIMPAPIVSHLAFGFRSFLADYYWVTAVQAFNKWDSRDAFYAEYFRIISTLDAKFEYPYTFAILTVPSPLAPESLVWMSHIAERGVAEFPTNWRIPFAAAMQFHIVGKSNADAVHFLEIAAAVSGAPELVHRTLAIYLMRDASDYQRSRALFTTLLQTSDNEETKRIISERLLLLDFVEVLDRASRTFKADLGRYPASVGDLTKQGYITEIPKALIEKFRVSIDQTTGKVGVR